MPDTLNDPSLASSGALSAAAETTGKLESELSKLREEVAGMASQVDRGLAHGIARLQRATSSLAALEADQNAPSLWAVAALDEDPDPVRVLILYRECREILDMLPMEYACFELSHKQGWSNKEIAGKAGCTERHVLGLIKQVELPSNLRSKVLLGSVSKTFAYNTWQRNKLGANSILEAAQAKVPAGKRRITKKHVDALKARPVDDEPG